MTNNNLNDPSDIAAKTVSRLEAMFAAADKRRAFAEKCGPRALAKYKAGVHKRAQGPANDMINSRYRRGENPPTSPPVDMQAHRIELRLAQARTDQRRKEHRRWLKPTRKTPHGKWYRTRFQSPSLR